MLPISIEAIRKFVSPAPTRIVILSAPPRPAHRSLIDRLGIEWLDESGIIPGLPLAAMPSIIAHDNTPRSGWYFQQFLKWGARRLSRNPFFAVVDADTAFVAPVSLLEGKKYVFQRSRQRHAPYFTTYQRLLGLAPEAPDFDLPSYISDHMIFDVALVDELIAAIEKRNPGKPWYRAILDTIDFREMSSFSEFETYGNFLAKFHPGSYVSIPYANMILPKDRARMHEQNASAARQRGFTSISYHSFTIEEIYITLREIAHYLPLQNLRVVLDVGSRNVDFAIIARRFSPAANIYVFECDPDALDCCRQNLSGRTDIRIVESAVGDATMNTGTARPKLALWDWAPAQGIETIDILWLNLRAGIGEVIGGLGALIRKVKVIVARRPAAGEAGESPLSRIPELLRGHGFLRHEPASGIEQFNRDIYVRADIAEGRGKGGAVEIIGRTATGGAIVTFGKKAD